MQSNRNVSEYMITEILVQRGDIRFVGHYSVEPPSKVRQVIARQGAKPTDLQIKKGQGGWELEILLPPHTFEQLAAVFTVGTPTCRIDRDHASLFEIVYSCRVNSAYAEHRFLVEKS